MGQEEETKADGTSQASQIAAKIFYRLSYVFIAGNTERFYLCYEKW